MDQRIARACREIEAALEALVEAERSRRAPRERHEAGSDDWSGDIIIPKREPRAPQGSRASTPPPYIRDPRRAEQGRGQGDDWQVRHAEDELGFETFTSVRPQDLGRKTVLQQLGRLLMQLRARGWRPRKR